MPSQWAEPPLRLRAGVNMWSPKPQTFRSKKYFDFVKTLTCVISDENCMGDIIPHHCEAGGMGMKCNDTRTIPVCVHHHDEVHRGSESFFKKYCLDMWKCIAETIEKFVVNTLKK